MKKQIKLFLCTIAAAALCACEAGKGLKDPIYSSQFISADGGIMQASANSISIEKVNRNTYKPVENANPISPLIYCADPTAVEYEGRLYVYGTRDHQQFEASMDENADNTYEKIRSFVCFSSDDMVNWTYEGDIDVGSVAPWAWASWAPTITSRVEEDGLTHFYLYFSNSGAGVGVITSTNPVGPWSDPLGKPLISSETPGLSGCPNPFDPGVVIDDNGVGWLAFGGGTAEGGSDYMPGSARIVRLGKDMLSFDSAFAEIPAPYFFEASELNYINGKFFYTCCSNWVERSVWDYEGYEKARACAMISLVSDDPLNKDSWKYNGDYFLNPGDMGYRYSNNHTHLHKYDGKYFVFSHSMAIMEAKDKKGGFRSLCVDEIGLDEKTLAVTQTGTNLSGVNAIRKLDGSGLIKGETMTTCSSGISLEKTDDRIAVFADGEEKDSGEWILLKNVLFDDPKSLLATVKGKGRIELRPDSLDAPASAWLEFDFDDYTTCENAVSGGIKGTHDVYVVMTDGVYLDEWQVR